MSNPFNSVFETTLRILVLMEVFIKPKTVDMLCMADFVTTYGLCFGVSNHNINGENKFKFSELAARREKAGAALRDLCLMGLAISSAENDGINYSLTETGSKLASELDSAYAEGYRATAQRTVEILVKMDEQEVLNLIAHEASVSIGGAKE